MLRRALLAISLLWCSGAALAASVTDATGRPVEVPERIARVLPAGPPAAVFLAALAPDLMLGWTSPVPADARALLAPEAARLPQVPRLTGRDDMADKIAALKPDLILDYGTVAPRYADLAQADAAAHRHSHRAAGWRAGGDPAAPSACSAAFCIGEERAETLASFAEALLALPPTPSGRPRVLCARGRRWPDRRRTRDRPGRDLRPSRLAVDRAAR